MVRRRVPVVIAAVLLTLATIPAFLSLGTEFMPPLNEGTILYMPTAPPGMSITEAQRVLQMQDRELAAFPEVERVFGKIGRAETSTDPAPLSMVETVVTLKPESRMAPGRDLRRRWCRRWTRSSATPACRTPGGCRSRRAPRCSRPACAASSASRSSATISPRSSARRSRSSARSQDVPGTRSAFAERLTGGFYLDVEVDRDAIARHGLRVRDVNGGGRVCDRRHERRADGRGSRALPDRTCATRATSARTSTP